MKPSEQMAGSWAEGSFLLALTLALLLTVALLLSGGTNGAAAQAQPEGPCQPVADVVLTYSPTTIYASTPVQFNAEILSGSLPISYTWDLGDGSDPLSGTTGVPLFTVTHNYTSTGLLTVELTAWNTCTLPPLSVTAPITIEAQPCLTVTDLSLAYTPTQVYTYTEVLFIGEVLSGTPPVTYTWAFGDGTPPITATAEGLILTATHTYTAADAYTVALAAWNACTITPARQSLTLTVAPCEAISDVVVTYWPTAARVGEVITFTAGLTGGSPPWAFDWAFGDGLTATGAVVTHAYTAPLTYTLALTASNPCSQRATTATLHILPPPVRVFVPVVFRDFEPWGWAAHLGYGANIASADHVTILAEMGFDWAKGWAAWDDVGTGPDYNWINVDNQLAQFVTQVDHVLLRIGGPPPPDIGNPPVSPDDLEAFYDMTLALATHVSDTWRSQGLATVAYEIWNEPNLDYEWGWQPPNAAQYTALLQKGYLGIKAGDPQAIVVSAGLATTGDFANLAWSERFYGADQAAPDLVFLQQMYDAGAKGYFDALGSHPYGGPDAPDTPPNLATGPIYFRRAEEQHQVMIDNGDDSPLWATEFGWILRSDECDLGEHEWMEVSEAQQAQYLADAHVYADEQWPWMGPMFFFNLDFGTVDWYAHCDPVRWYSITYRETPPVGPILYRQAFYSLRDMRKHSAW